MTISAKTLAAASCALACVFAAPASAQVQGTFGTVDAARAVIGTTAFQNAYTSITSTYQPQFDARRQLTEQRQTHLATIDTNNDNEVDDNELQAAQGTAAYTSLQQVEGQIAALTAQIDGARIFAIEQVYSQYSSALEDVINADQIQLVLDPNSIIYAPREADLTAKVITALNGKVATVAVVPTQEWQPQRTSVALYQQIQQLLLTAQAIQQAQAAQQQQQDQAEQPATQAPSGR